MTIQFTEDPQRNLGALLNRTDPALPHDRFSSALVEHTEAQLNDTYARLVSLYTEHRTPPNWLLSIAVSLRDNAIVVGTTPGGFETAQQEIPESEFPGVQIDGNAPRGRHTACGSRANCNNTRGGVGLRVGSPSGTNRCTAGFTVQRNDVNERALATAAHCSEFVDGRGVSQGIDVPNYRVGNTANHLSGAFFNDGTTLVGYDAQLAILSAETDPTLTMEPRIYHSAGDRNYAVSALGGFIAPGTFLCFSGTTSAAQHGDGPLCGGAGFGPSVVTLQYGGVTYVNAVSYKFDNVCGLGGDSGAPVYASNTLYGLHFATFDYPVLGCVLTSGAVYSPAAALLDLWGVSLVTA